MDTIKAIKTRRTIRKFKQEPIPTETLLSIVDAARMAPQGSNRQPMCYCIITDPDMVAAIFTHVRWAGAIAPNGNPLPGEEPMAYVLLLHDSSITKGGDVDAGAVGATFLLAAHALGVGACWMGAINRPEIAQLAGVAEPYTLHTLFAMGYPAESPTAEEATDSVVYYKDENGTLHVPKRPLDQIVFYNGMKR